MRLPTWQEPEEKAEKAPVQPKKKARKGGSSSGQAAAAAAAPDSLSTPRAGQPVRGLCLEPALASASGVLAAAPMTPVTVVAHSSGSGQKLPNEAALGLLLKRPAKSEISEDVWMKLRDGGLAGGKDLLSLTLSDSGAGRWKDQTVKSTTTALKKSLTASQKKNAKQLSEAANFLLRNLERSRKIREVLSGAPDPKA